jgi:hypothetical protein
MNTNAKGRSLFFDDTPMKPGPRKYDDFDTTSTSRMVSTF